MANISDVKNCYGCGVCAVSCPRQIIDIRQNQAGFYAPIIVDYKNCSDCGLCRKVCSFLEKPKLNFSFEVRSFAAWSNDQNVRNGASSGGVSFEIGRSLIEQGFKACGVRYDVLQKKAEHFIANTEEEWKQSIGSKYIQSYTVDAFKKIEKGKKYFVVGTPCQIGSLRKYIKTKGMEENFVLMDFFCHGVPSKKIWDKYLEKIQIPGNKIGKILWRNKKKGWHNSYFITISGKDELIGLVEPKSPDADCEILYESGLNDNDVFFNLFLSDYCLGKQCYDTCPYKGAFSVADIRIGDFWGAKYKENQLGVNAVLALSQKGLEILEKSKCSWEKCSLSEVMDGQMLLRAKRPLYYHYLRRQLEKNINAQSIFSHFLLYQKVKRRLIHPLRSLKNFWRKIV